MANEHAPDTTQKTFWRALFAFAVSEIASKATRFLVVLVVARVMDPAAIGLAAAAMASGEILKAFVENGVFHRIIAATKCELQSICAAGHRIMWRWCLGLSCLQNALALGVYLTTGDAFVSGMIALLSLEYFFMPGGVVQAALAMREGKMVGAASVSGGQVVTQNLITVALVIICAHPIAIVLPKLLAAPVWLIGMRRLRPWRPAVDGQGAGLKTFITFGGPVLGVEIVKALRLHADKLVIGGMLGSEALGLYFFAFSAGLGLANSVSQAFSLVLFPRLCAASDRFAALGSATRVALVFLVPLVLLQAALAPVYVPLLFGERWAEATELVTILCLMAAPAIIWSGAAQALRADRRTGREFAVTLLLATAMVGGAVLAAPYGLIAIAWTQMLLASVIQVVGAWPALRAAITPPTPLPVKA